MKKELPIFKLTINSEDSEVNYVALVDDPATERVWMAFNSIKQRFQANEERKIISGALMIADLPIYRRDNIRGEYYVVFDKSTIECIAQKFFKRGYTSNVNEMHDSNKKIDGVYMFESMLIDSDRGILPPRGFEGLTDGSWFGSYKVENNQVWNEFIKSGIFKGFSVEGNFDYNFEDTEDEKTIKEIINSLC